jgi:16S rRNA (guanine1516-N2)-methyltransferase
MPANWADLSVSETTPGLHTLFFSLVTDPVHGWLSLQAAHHPEYGSIHADWLGAEQRRRILGGRKQLLARAVGLHQHPRLSVLDATAGLGRDGFTLAALGAELTLCERHPLIFALLEDAARRAASHPAAQRLELIHASAAQLLDGRRQWDVIYLDPMYPHRGKAALPQKEMQFFRELTDGDPDADSLLALALPCARRKVVVKRAARAAPLGGLSPSRSLKGQQARFDIYLPRPVPCAS